MSDTKTLADLIAANPGVVKPGMSVSDVKRALVAAQGQNVDGRTISTKQALELMDEGKRVWLDGTPRVKAHVPVTTEDEAVELSNAMAAHGNYPAGLDACFVAGLNGDAGPNGECIFAGTPTCTCDDEPWGLR